MNFKGVFSHKFDDWRTPDFIFSYFIRSTKVYDETAHGVPPGGCPSQMRRVASSVRRPLDDGEAGPMK